MIFFYFDLINLFNVATNCCSYERTKKEINDEFKQVFKKRNETPEGIAINIIQTLEYKYNKKTMAAIRR